MSKETNDGKKGGMLKGNSHDKGGIKAVVVDTGQPVELEGGEIIINKKSAKKHRKLLSEINQDGGGVPIPAPDEYKYGGEVVEFNRNDKPNTFAIKFARRMKKEMPEIWKKYGNSFENNLYEVLDKVFQRGYWKANEKDHYKVWKMYCFNNKPKDDIESIVGMFKCGAVTDKGYSHMKKKVEQLHKGQEHEMEHEETLKKMKTGKHTVKEGAEMVASDHLEEHDEYYDELHELERGWKHKMKSGGDPDLYKRWRSLVNMSKSELEKFYNSEEGKKAGLSAKEAKSQGISSGRESARWIMKMKDTPVKEWTDTMWKWAGKQVSFISRMKGNKGDLYEDDGSKTRKHLSLLIWGHNPKKDNGSPVEFKDGGKIEDITDDQIERGYGIVKKVDGKIIAFLAYNSGGQKDLTPFSSLQVHEMLKLIGKLSEKEVTTLMANYYPDARKIKREELTSPDVDKVVVVDHMVDNPIIIYRTEKMEKGGAIKDQYDKVVSDLALHEKMQDDVKAINKLLRDTAKDYSEPMTREQVTQELEKAGYKTSWVEAIRFYADGRRKVAAYVLTNNRAKIKRLQDKVNLYKRQMESSSSSSESGEDKYTFADGYVLVNPDIDRVQIIFDDTFVPKPLYKKLRSNGWVFSRTNKAFQRKLTPQAIDNAVNMFNAKKEGETTETKVEKVEQRIGIDEALEMVNSRQFSYVSVYLRKAVKDTGYVDDTYPRLVYLSQLSHEVKDGVRAYFKKHFPKLDVDSMEIAVYKKTYVRESRELVKAGRYLPSDESPEKVLGENLAKSLSEYFGEGAKPDKKKIKTFYFLENTPVKRTEKGETDDDFFKRAESITGYLDADRSDILTNDVIIVGKDGVEYEVDIDKITTEEIKPSQTKYKIDGKIYDLTDVELPADHPIMILDTDSPQWRSAVKEYFEEKSSETKTDKMLWDFQTAKDGIIKFGSKQKAEKARSMLGKNTPYGVRFVSGSIGKADNDLPRGFYLYNRTDSAWMTEIRFKELISSQPESGKESSELKSIVDAILKYKSFAKSDYGAAWSKLTLPYGMLKKLWVTLDKLKIDRYLDKGKVPPPAENDGYKIQFILTPDREFWTEVETPDGEIFKLQQPEIAGASNINARFYLGEEKVEDAKTEVTEPNTGDEFDEAVMDAIEPKDDWIGHLIKERDVKKQIADLIKGGDENEREIAVNRIYQKFYDRELEKSDKWVSREDKYKAVIEKLYGKVSASNDNEMTDFLMNNYEEYLNSALDLGYDVDTIVHHILEKEAKKHPELNLKEKDPEHAFKGIDHNYKNQYTLNKAVEALIDDRGDSPDAYDAEEKNFIRKYSGYGGLGDYGDVGKGGLYEFYTPPEVIERMWGLAYKYGYNDGDVLEPAVGTGEFLHFMPKNASVVAYDINEYSSKIVKISFPTVEMNLQPFEKLFISKNYTIKNNIEDLKKFDLVIGNPPYGQFKDFQSRYMSMGELDHVKPKNYVEYFLRRSVDLLNPDGLLVFIVGAQLKNGGRMFLDSGNSPVKEYLAKHTEFLTAYRLPDTVFERTGVTSDIIVLKKK